MLRIRARLWPVAMGDRAVAATAEGALRAWGSRDADSASRVHVVVEAVLERLRLEDLVDAVEHALRGRLRQGHRLVDRRHAGAGRRRRRHVADMDAPAPAGAVAATATAAPAGGRATRGRRLAGAAA